VSKTHATLPHWTWAAPLAGWAMIGAEHALDLHGGWFAVLVLVVLIATVFACVHHAEVLAHVIGEPFGTLVLSVAVTIVELSLIITLMLAGGEEAFTLARDSVFAAFMIATTGIVGACLLASGLRYGEVGFQARGAGSALSVLAALATLVLVMPNYTLQTNGPVFSSLQLGAVAAVSLVLYLTFVFVQTVRHRAFFLSEDDAEHAEPPTAAEGWRALAMLAVALVAVVLLAEALAPTLDALVAAAGAPRQVAGIAIASLVMLPEAMSALRAARMNRMQTSLNLALGSALATIGLTIPSVAILSEYLDEPLVLGISAEQTVLLLLTLLVSTLTLTQGRTTILQGAVHLTIFAVFLLLAFVP
jgi:Ca2+:H+ antiporter